MLNYKLSEIIDMPQLKELLGAFCKLTGYPVSIKDNDDNTLINFGQQPACTEFHQKHPGSLQLCNECVAKVDKVLAKKEVAEIKCGNGIWDIAGPIEVDGVITGRFYIGQFFREEEAFDQAYFTEQAEKYGYDKQSYFEAIAQIPRISANKLEQLKNFYMTLAQQIGKLGASLLRQKEEMQARQEAEEELRAQQMKYSIITENSPDAIFSADANGVYKYVNSSHEKILGYRPADLIGKSIFEVLDKKMEGVARYIQKELLTGKSMSGQTQTKHKNGEWIDIKYYIVPLIEQGEVKGATGQVRDITFEKRAEKELMAREERYRKLFEGNPVPLWEFEISGVQAFMAKAKQEGYTDLQSYMKEKGHGFREFTQLGRLMNVNKACLELYAAKDLKEIQQHFRDNFTRRGKTVVLELFAAMNRGDKEYAGESELIDYKGKRKYTLVQAIFPDDPTDPTLLVSLTDITQIKKYEEELVKAKQKAEESDKLKTAFLSNISHEIRTPLNGIVGFSQMLAEDELPEEKKKRFMELISINNKQLLDIINDIIDLSHIESGLVKLQPTQVNLNELFEQLYASYLPECERAGLELFFETKGNRKKSMLICDGTKLRQILNNMMRNALKFTKKGRISFGFDQKGSGNSYYFWVQDTGVGISKDQQEVIFQRFHQAMQPGLAKSRGSGLGLAISKAYVEMMNGQIGVESEPGVGSKFWFTVKCRHINGKKKTANKDKPPFEQIRWDELQIMIVEDEKVNTELIENFLSPYQIELISVSSGEECIGVMKSGLHVDLILMDIKLPGIDGAQTLKELRKMGITAPVIAQTAFGFEHNKKGLLESGFDDYLSKPLDKDKIIKTMGNILIKEKSND